MDWDDVYRSCAPQVLAHLVKGYFCLAQASLLELGQLSARCLREQDPSVQLHGAKVRLSVCLFICLSHPLTVDSEFFPHPFKSQEQDQTDFI